jgi:hypothetical protein
MNDQRKPLMKTVRLWGLSLISAAAGATTVWLTDSLPYGIVAFAVVLLILGPLLWRYEKRHHDD